MFPWSPSISPIPIRFPWNSQFHRIATVSCLNFARRLPPDLPLYRVSRVLKEGMTGFRWKKKAKTRREKKCCRLIQCVSTSVIGGWHPIENIFTSSPPTARNRRKSPLLCQILSLPIAILIARNVCLCDKVAPGSRWWYDNCAIEWIRLEVARKKSFFFLSFRFFVCVCVFVPRRFYHCATIATIATAGHAMIGKLWPADRTNRNAPRGRRAPPPFTRKKNLQKNPTNALTRNNGGLEQLS